MTTRFLFSLVMAIFLGLNVQETSASDQFRDDPNWENALALISSSSRIGDADPAIVLSSLAETHGVSGVMDLGTYNLMDDFVLSEIKRLGASAFVKKSNSLENRRGLNRVKRSVVEPLDEGKKIVSVVHPISGKPIEVIVAKSWNPGGDSFDNKSVQQMLAEVSLGTNKKYY